MLGKIEGGRKRGQQRMKWLDGITNSMDMCLSKLQCGNWQGSPACCSPCGAKRQTQLKAWMELNWNSGWLNCTAFIFVLQLKTTRNTSIIEQVGFMIHWIKVGSPMQNCESFLWEGIRIHEYLSLSGCFWRESKKAGLHFRCHQKVETLLCLGISVKLIYMDSSPQ